MQILNSPVSGKPMEQITLESGLNAWRCEKTGGHYIPSGAYLQWVQQQPARLPHLPEPSEPTALSTDAAGVLICPETGTFMSRFKVGHGFPFSIDRSITGGVWLDGGEWEALRQRNFHDEIHLVFTSPWQKQVRNEKAQATYEETLKASLGSDLLERLTLLRNELLDHPHKNLAFAYLAEKTNTLEKPE
ncbi:MAG: hypothetical protein ABI162_04755 [Luteolibacter sp.]